ncbi:hypothetical protein Ahy_B07g087075 [Arachis hypogaea]|uniref:Uncharacterized protein n=1 Tax=Arachis hypogaea TaxID=3818 RepID=A0A444YB61_ARAHY|nr:hypothetical protein Ahy_B07g087075 [Arachis hypogaea]
MSIVDETSIQPNSGAIPNIELYIEFEHITTDGIQHYPNVQDDRTKVHEGINSDSEEEFKTTYEAGDEDEDGDVGGETVVKTVVVLPVVSQPIDVLPFMRSLDLDAMHAPEFPKYANIGVADSKDRKFMVRIEYNFRKSVITVIRSYTISRGVDYVVYESEPHTFYAKCKTSYDRRCNWLIRASLIWNKSCW